MPPKNFAGDDPLQVRNESALEQFDQQVYGALAGIPDSGRIVAKPIDVFSVRPDIQQPRRILPMAVRGDWNGDPAGVPVVLGRWLAMVQHQIGGELPIKQVLLGEWENTLTDLQKSEPVVWSFFDIAGLAITIVQSGQREAVEYAEGVLIDGERRWWATHMLNAWAGKVAGRDFSKILAAEKAKPDVWAQATRNGARTTLNAIEMARQVGLLVMAMYEGDAGVKFESFKALVLPGGIDRAFYAQVANGNVYRIKRGMTEKVMAATGLKSESAVRNHRALLNIPDALWMKADEQNWTEWQIREYLDGVKAANEDATKLHSVTDVTVSPTQSPPAEGKAILETVKPRAVGGLYVDPTPMREAQRAMVSGRIGNDDDFDDDDGFEEDEYQPPAQDYPQARTTESTTAFARVWDGQGNKIVPVLELLRSLTDNREVKMRLTELLTLAPSDVVRLLEGTRQGWWNQYVQESIALIEPVFREQIFNALNEYVAYIKQEGDYLSDKYSRE